VFWDNTVLLDRSDFSTSGNYVQYTYTMVASSSSTELQFNAYDVPNFLDLDDVSVTVVPTPGAIWLLGSGLICTVRLRRRFKT